MNGAEVIQGDACQARNGIVHIINDVIRSSNDSLVSVLNNNPDLSKFAALVKKAGLERLLNSKKVLSTVFAPEDSSINDHIPDCLCQPENKEALYKFVLFHITGGAESNNTITLRDSIYTTLCYHGRYGYHHRCTLKVSVENGEVTIGNSEVIETDIPASNGVLHIISEPFNNQKLNKLCPPPPTTSPTATSSGSGELPVTTSESPATTTESSATTITDPTRPPEEA